MSVRYIINGFLLLLIPHNNNVGGDVYKAELKSSSLVLFKIFNLMGNGSFIKLAQSPSDWSEHIPNEPGLYLITVASGDNPKSDDLRSTYVKWPNNGTDEESGTLDILPLYLGETSHLQHRLEQHADMRRCDFMGKFQEARYVCVGRSQILPKNTFVFYIKMPRMVAKWMEAALLATFDFAFDTEEQLKDKIRSELETNPEEDDFEKHEKLDNVIKIYNGVIDTIRTNLKNYYDEFGDTNIEFVKTLNSLKIASTNTTSVDSSAL